MTQWAIEDGNISEASGTATNILSGLAKAWIDLDMPNSTIDESFNISSVTDNSVGNFTLSLTNAMGSSAYSRSCTTGKIASVRQDVFSCVESDTYTASSYVLQVDDSTGGEQDNQTTSAAHGDLA